MRAHRPRGRVGTVGAAQVGAPGVGQIGGDGALVGGGAVGEGRDALFAAVMGMIGAPLATTAGSGDSDRPA